MAVVTSVVGVTLDCPNPQELAEFYKEALGWEVVWSDPNSAYLSGKEGVKLGFQRVDDFQAPQWPGQDAPQQLHLELSVADLDDAEAQLVSLGASKPSHQPGGDRWRVLSDPVGHPFCITTAV